MYYFVMLTWAFCFLLLLGTMYFCSVHSATGMRKKQKYKLQSSLTSKVVLFDEMCQRNLNTVVVVSTWGQVVVRALLFRAP